MYIKRKDALEMLGKLAREPHYQHEGEDYYVGISEASGEIYSMPPAEIEECNCFETDDKYEYWGYWIICKCGFNNVKGAKFCSGCGKKINVIGTTEDYPK